MNGCYRTFLSFYTYMNISKDIRGYTKVRKRVEAPTFQIIQFFHEHLIRVHQHCGNAIIMSARNLRPYAPAGNRHASLCWLHYVPNATFHRSEAVVQRLIVIQ